MARCVASGTVLRGTVAENYGSCEQFAKALNWSGQKARNIVSGRQVPNADEIKQMAIALNVFDKPDDFMRIFFPDNLLQCRSAEA